MIEKISENVLIKLRSEGLDTDDIDFNELVDRQVGALMRPKVNVSINTGTFQKVTLQTYKVNLLVSLFVIVQNVSGEKERRFAAYALINAIINILLLEKLGLPLQDPLTPAGFNNVTDKAFSDAGYSLYQLNFNCSYNFRRDPDPGDEGELELIVNQYFLQDPTDDGNEDAEGYVYLAIIYGGDAFSQAIDTVFGGHAQSIFEIAIYGGKASSTY